MKKILLVALLCILLADVYGTIIISGTGPQCMDKTYHISVPSLLINEYDEYYHDLSFENSSLFIMTPGEPMLPKIVTTLELPFGVHNIKVEVKPGRIQETVIEKEIRFAPAPVSLFPGGGGSSSQDKNKDIYSSNDLYPSSWYHYDVGCGLNSHNQHVTYLNLEFFPVRYRPLQDTLHVAQEADIVVTYDKPSCNPFPATSAYDLVIITPPDFSDSLQSLVDHKNAHDMQTLLKTTEDIYAEYTGVDNPEKIKYFIKDAIEEWGITYVLLVGGLKSSLLARPRDDTNQGTRDWHVPVRYNNLFDNPEHPLSEDTIHDPGVISDLYYADIYKEGGLFEDWDPNGDGIFAAWSRPGAENDTGLDLYPDVYLGRLACRNRREVENLVEKIITYESQPADPSWFKKIVVISGDGFLDQEDLDIQWDVQGLSSGEYTIYAQSIDGAGMPGPLDIVQVTVDQSKDTSVSFNHDDYLKVQEYPFPAIAEITSPSDGDILGNADYFYQPTETEAYCNAFTGWADVNYTNGIMHIRGKSYDPKPYGNITDIHVWIKNSDGSIVFSEWRNGTEMYYEGEWVTGGECLQGQGGALYYMPDDFEEIILWASNGKLTGQSDVIETLNEGCGFAFFSGHGSPGSWGDHYPGVPGNRQHGSFTGLVNLAFFPPVFPMDTLTNTDKPFICVVGGCHNSQFNVSLAWSMLDLFNIKSMWTFGMPTPECWSWWLTRLPERGAIATIGNTGLGYGILGKDCTIGGFDGWISKEFFRQYAEENHTILGDAYGQTLISYVTCYDLEEDDHVKSVEQWVLLGDPSLKIGGYTE